MSRFPLHALRWSSEQHLYELYTKGVLSQRFRPTDEATWLAWLGEATSFAFHSPQGALNVYREQRLRGGTYWYAYHTSRGRTRKRYLGPTERATLARIEATAQALTDVHTPSSATKPGVAPLATKLTPPRLPHALVERPHLLSVLDGALATRLLLVSAPAGWGKTTLLAAWAHQHQEHVAWLSLDELDNTPTRFWAAVIAALCTRVPGVGELALAMLRSPQPSPLPACLSALLNDLANMPEPAVPLLLLLDDYQVISDPAIHESLTFFLEHLPAHLHLSLASRVDPDLPLARWRARGYLTEIRADELRFSQEEASWFLRQMLVSPLSEDEVRQLSRRTEGWIAGLQLAALALEKHPDRAAFLQALTGSQRYLVDYVQEDILARLPTEVRDFLLQIAILSRLDAAVCQAVTAAPDRRVSQQLLGRLERANLFLVPLDEERRSYRLHSLFCEALLSVLHATQPELALLLHRRAAAYYETQGDFHEAITHRLAADDYSAAASLMAQTVEQFWVHGEATTMARWVLLLPQPLVYEHARLVLTTALYLLNTVAQTTQDQRARVYQQVRQLMAWVETALRREIDDTSRQISAPHADAGATWSLEALEARVAEDRLLHQRLRLLHLFMAFFEAAASWDDERLNHMKPEIEEALEQEEEAVWQIVPLACSFMLHYSVWQTGAVLVPQLLKAKAQVSQSGSHFAFLRVRHYLVYAALEAGQLRLAAEEGQAALDLIEQIAGYTMLKGYFEMALSQVWYQWNRLEEVCTLLHMVVRDAAAWQHLDLLGGGYAYLLQVALARGDWSLTQQALDEVEQLVRRERYGVYPDWLPTLRAQWWLGQGRLKEASDWAASIVFSERPWNGSSYDAFPVVMRVYFAELRWTEALALLERWSGHLDRPANIRITLTYLAQLLVALHQTGQREQASVIAARLFGLTEPEGYLRVYLDEGEPMREALQAVLTTPGEHHEWVPSTTTYIAKLLAAFEQEQHGASPSQDAATTPAPVPSPTPQVAPLASALNVSLTQREQQVLRLLAEGASNQEIAQTLVISLETVKKHVSNLLGKLGATSRTQAIALARARSLL